MRWRRSPDEAVAELERPDHRIVAEDPLVVHPAHASLDHDAPVVERPKDLGEGLVKPPGDLVDERGDLVTAAEDLPGPSGLQHHLDLRMDQVERHLLVACVCLVAHEQGETPRAVLERLFRRAVSDREWQEEFAPLLR